MIVATKDTPQARQEFRDKRDAWLDASDAYLAPDRGFTSEEVAAIQAWRQALRDSTLNGASAHLWSLPAPPEVIATDFETRVIRFL